MKRTLPSPSTTGSHAGRHAIVLGASTAGLLACQVLHHHFAHVTLVEQDPLARQVEACWDVAHDFARRVLALPNVRCLDGHEAIGLLSMQGGLRVRGVRVSPPGNTLATEVEGELVVDATGRCSRSPGWLAALGYGKPEETPAVDRGHLGTLSHPAGRWRRYDRLRQFPAGYLVIGEAVCSFDASSGLERAVAVEESEALDRCLRGGLLANGELARRFFGLTARAVGRARRSAGHEGFGVLATT